MTLDEIRDFVRWHEYRASAWSFAVPPERDYTRCGDCGRTEGEHPTPNVMLVPALHRVFVALLDVAETAHEIVSPEYRTADEPYAQGVRLDAMRDLMDALDRLHA